MGLATHLGPWLLGTVRNTTGSSAGSIRNLGATVVTQSNTLNYTNTTAKTLFTVPAGSQILNIIVDNTTAWNSGTGSEITVETAAGTDLMVVGSASVTPLAISRVTLNGDEVDQVVSGNIGIFNNVGTTDLVLQGKLTNTGTAATTGAATVTVVYVVRNSDGTYVPSTSVPYTGP